MKRFEYESIIDNYHKRYKKSLIFLIVSIFIMVSLFTIGVIIANYENKRMIMIIFSIALLVISFIFVTILLFGVIENKKNETQLLYILGGYMNIVEGKIVEINDGFTTISGRKAIELVLEDDKQQISVYFDPTLGDNPFLVNDMVTLKTSESFIVEYEVKNA